jgi:hypothetical protein
MGMLRRTLLAFLLAAILAPPAYAHSLKELEDKLVSKEKDFQPVDVAALEFTLTDADGSLGPGSGPPGSRRSSMLRATPRTSGSRCGDAP